MSTIRCPQCNLVHFASDSVCKRCGISFFTSEEPAGTAPFFGETQPFPPAAPDSFAYQRPQENQYQPPFNPTPQYGDFRQQPSSPFPNQKVKTGLAIFSLVAGIFSMPPISTFGAVFVGSLLAIGLGVKGFILGALIGLAVIPTALISGIVAMRRAKRSPHLYGGRGCAIGGVVCSSFALVVIPVIAAIAVPNLLAARRAANEGNAVMTMRRIVSAQDLAVSNNENAQCSDLSDLAVMGYIDQELNKGVRSGYKFEVQKIPTGGCEIFGTPESATMGNRAFYYSTLDGVLRSATKKGSKADKTDAPLNDMRDSSDSTPKIALQQRR